MDILQAENISLAFGHTALLDKVSFRLKTGEKVGLIGRNGAGKSSFLKILARLEKPDSGQLMVKDSSKVVYVPQESFLNPQQSVFDAVAEGLGALRDVLRRYDYIGEQLQCNGNNSVLLKEMHDLQTELEMHNGWQFDAAVRQAVSELGLPHNELISHLSGGQKKRVALAQAWVQKPDILLLDEPTNHLDIDAVLWLENLLCQFGGSMVMITHDRRFLDNTVSRIVALDRGILRSYSGSFSEYSQKKAQELAVEAEHRRLFDKFHAQEEAWIRKGIEARRTRNEGRVRRLEELRRQRACRREQQGQVNFTLNEGEKSGKIIAKFEDISFQYGNKQIISKFSTVIQRGDKIGLIGANGVGKTTFLKLVLGQLQPDSGRIFLGSRQEVAYFDQFRSLLNDNDTVFYTLGQGSDYVEVGGKKRHVMGYLEDFLFSTKRAFSPVASLSGGERSRLMLAKLFICPANILILDEPTNDLDIDTQELLEDLLRDYRGTVFLVSHDRMFLDNVVTQSIVFAEGGCLKEYIGGYQDYLDAEKREQAFFQKANREAKSTEKPRKPVNRTVKLSYKEQRELDMLPAEITQLEIEQAELNRQLAENPDIFKDYEKANEWKKRAEQIDMLLSDKLARWEWLENKQSGIGL